MAKFLSEQQVSDIASYAQLCLNEDELSQMTLDLNSIVSTLDSIAAYKVEADECMNHDVNDEANAEGVCAQKEALAWLDLSKKLQPHDACFVSCLGGFSASSASSADFTDSAAKEGDCS